VQRLIDAGAVPVGLTTASEYGGVNVTRTVLNGTTRNPWNPAHTPGGSSGGSASAVAGGILTAATAGDGGGSIRIPAGFCGLVGLKVTYGRIPNGPSAEMGNLTAVPGCVSRSVRDTARWLDVTNGADLRTPLALPKTTGWESGLGSHVASLRGLRVAVLPDFGGAYVNPVAWDMISALGSELISALGMREVDVTGGPIAKLTSRRRLRMGFGGRRASGTRPRPTSAKSVGWRTTKRWPQCSNSAIS
jgi:aspartyl-tRNA(Asn)/glutamyl-tRNA(Gln) amidotransferase subunit A